MAFKESRSLAPAAPDKKPPVKREVIVSADKTAKNLFRDSSFTISKLADRASRSMKDVTALTALRHNTEVQLATDAHALGIPLTATETQTLQKMSDDIQIAMDKARENFHLAQEARVALDKELNDLGVEQDSPMRLSLKSKQESTAAMIDDVNKRFNDETDAQVHSARFNKVRQALSTIEEPPVRTPKQGPNRPMTGSFSAEDPSAQPNATFTAAEHHAYADAFDAADALDQEGVMSQEDVAARIAQADAEDDAARMAEVAPGYTAAEQAARDARTTRSVLTRTASGARLVNVARSTETYKEGRVADVSTEDTAAELAADRARIAEVAPARETAPTAKATWSELTPTTSGDRQVNVARSKRLFQGENGQPAEFGHEAIIRGLEETKARQEEALKAPEAIAEEVDFTKMTEDLDTIQQQIGNGLIRDMYKLNEALNTLGLRSTMNELLDPKDHDKNIADLAGKKGFFGGKPKFDVKTAVAYFQDLTNKAYARGADARAMGSKIGTPKKQIGDNSPVNRRPPSSSSSDGLARG